MLVNFAYEYSIFRQKQEKLRERYKSLGMSEEQIREMYMFDLRQLNRDLAYRRHVQCVGLDSEIETQSRRSFLCKDDDRLSVTQKSDETRPLWWLDEMEDEALVNKLKMLSTEELNLIDMLVFQGLSQTEIGTRLKISQAAVSQRINTIRKRIKKRE